MAPAGVVFTTDSVQPSLPTAAGSGSAACTAMARVAQAGRPNFLLKAASSAATCGLPWAARM